MIRVKKEQKSANLTNEGDGADRNVPSVVQNNIIFS